jgi:hypothetical protein
MSTSGSTSDASDGSAAGTHAARPPRRLLAGPSTSAEFNTFRSAIVPRACFRLEDVRFDFDSSVLLPEVASEMPALRSLMLEKQDYDVGPGAAPLLPVLSIFGHTDPEGSDDYNKALGGRRAAVVYGLLTRRVDVWHDLYEGTGLFTSASAGDQWGIRSIQVMLNALPADPSVQPPPDPLEVDGQTGPLTRAAVRRFQSANGLAVDGDPGHGTRDALFQAYMKLLCVDAAGQPWQLDPKTNFLGRHGDGGGKGDFQGCGEFNPLMLFSQAELQSFTTPDQIADRNERNRQNRRVMTFLFAASARVTTDYWPCPRAKEGTAGCRARFWSDGDRRRANGASEREFAVTADTFACRFYQRLLTGSPCEGAPLPPMAGPCKMVGVKGTLKIAATDLTRTRAATFAWSTTSALITLTDADTATVTVHALDAPSASLGAEQVTLTCTTTDGSPDVARTVGVTVVRVTFAASPNQLYGFDDFDTPDDPSDNHVCVKSADHTFVKVTIEGGAVGTDLTFACDDAGTCAVAAPDATASFDLRLNAGATNKGQTVLRAKTRCSRGPVPLAVLAVHVYKQRVVSVSVAKIDNPSQTFLRFPTADYAAHATLANPKLKEGVVRYDITNYAADNSTTPVAYASGTGTLSYDIGQGGGADLTAISQAMSGVPAGTVRVAIIREMKSYYYLKSAVAAGDTTITVTAGARSMYYKAGDQVPIGTGTEQVSIVSVSGSTITCAALQNGYPAGTSMEFSAGGWGSDPILIMEGRDTLEVAKWTVLHEVGHRPLGLTLADIEDRNDFMNYMQNWTDYRLRFCPRTKHYPPAAGTGPTENQWDLIPRT